MNYKSIDETTEDKLIKWWQGLEDNRGDRAILRRASFIDDVFPTSAFFNFLDYVVDLECLNNSKEKEVVFTGYAIVASIVARVKENNDTDSFAKSLSLPEEKPVMSELRFQKLLKSDDPEQFFIRIRRAVDLLKGKVNIISLTNDILHWVTEFYHGKDKKPTKRLAFCWATDYYT